MTSKVFLGGVCKDTSWRTDIAIPELQEHNVEYFNPQKKPGEWKKELVEEESMAKRECNIILFYITSEYPSITSMLELLHLGSQDKHVFCVVDDFTPSQGQYSTITSDVERARVYLKDMLKENKNTRRFLGIKEAVNEICKIYKC
eukprot:GAHX01000434.1.p1 GENE.GAHX01000434.1~~GAHX01000434.1.p1  ORF type:complete len:145 (-),score=20.36 GAHX01000434.1:56-490(-)